jgi:hypothetical protein
MSKPNFIKFHDTQAYEISWNSGLWNFMKFHEIKPNEISWNFMKSFITRLIKFHEIWRIFFHEKNFMKNFIASRNDFRQGHQLVHNKL